MKLRTKISFQFLIQFIVLFITFFKIFIGLFILIVNFATNQEIEVNPHKAIVENIPINILIFDDDKVTLSDKWTDLLKENNTWLQIINEEGNEIFQKTNLILYNLHIQFMNFLK